ncbi:response regulator [Mucilaginibacter sp. UR6-1]|uniref:hybrid sensor histidine kinase/response regulator transcription factor n=1 Tax=Mucilaginibacter sp. UR6-1 TaxID=1435643 RepID=UPI001E5722ED|nr:two-component regulator propeller domain-containing protein [Mucilaginibacter sp. UR6-1]MCC8410115.1 response regulator [Mucilaginibacter sp. UR6-1]
MRGLLKSLICLVLPFALCKPVIAQVWRASLNKVNAPGNYALKVYTTNDGLPSKTTTCAYTDRRGFLWVGSENGLCKFDGYTFKTFVTIPGDSTTITSNYVNAIVEDSRGRLWVGTMDGLNLFDPLTEKFVRFYHDDKDAYSLSNNKIWSLLADTRGRIWVGTDDGFNQYNEKSTHKFTVYQPDAASVTAMKGKSVNAIVEDRQGNLWLGNWSSGLNKFDVKTRKFSNYQQRYTAGDKNPNDVWSLCYDGDGRIWVGTYWKGLFCFDPSTEKFTAYSCTAGKNSSVFSIMAAGKNSLLIGGSEHYYWLNTANKTWQVLPDIANFSNGSSYTDKNGIIWICSNSGLIKIDRGQYKFNLFKLALGQRPVKAMLVADSCLWIGTSNGLFKYDYRTGKNQTYFHAAAKGALHSDDIIKLYRDSKGDIWVLTENGFDRYDQQANKFIHHEHHSAIGSLFNEDVFRDIIEVAPGEYWLATDAGLKIFNSQTGKFTHYFNQKNNKYSISNNHVYSLLKDGSNTVWVGTYGGGLNRFDRRTGRFYSYTTNNNVKGNISNNIIKTIFPDSRGNLWVCTPDGLNRFDKNKGTFEVYSRRNGFASNVFNDITEDKAGNIWALTEKGASVLDPVKKVVRNFDEADGLFVNSVMFNDRLNGIYLAGTDGVIYFDPLKIKYNEHVPPVYFSDFQVFNKTVIPGADAPLKENLNLAREVTLNYHQSVFSVEFVGLSFTHPEKNEYAYKLSGFDKKWNYVGRQRKATYTNLNPGTYKLLVKGSNNDGVWNNKGSQLIITILPPWYLTWWAYALYALAAIGVIYAYILYRERQARLEYEIKISHIENEKEKELNEKKLSFFTNVSHEFRTPLTLIINPVKELLYRDDKNVDTTNLNVVYRNARRLLGLVDQLLLFRKADLQADHLKVSGLNAVNLSKEVFLCFSHQARSKNIQFDFNTNTDAVELYADREKLEIVLFNLLSNAIKFTPEGGRVGFTIKDKGNEMLIEIADTGCGIPETTGEKLYDRFYQEPGINNSLKGGFGIGLYIVRTFIEKHKGTITYQSKVDKGTTFTIVLLKGKAHLNDCEIIEDVDTRSEFLKELIEDEITANAKVEAAEELLFDDKLASDVKTLLLIDDNDDVREYLKQIFKLEYRIYEADNGEDGLRLVKEYLPDLVISDVMMQGMSGIELCSVMKEDVAISHIPIILLTASSSPEIKLKGIEGGADDYISKPFEKEILKARVASILKSKNHLQKYFYNEVTLNSNNLRISAEYKEFLDNCISIVDKHITDPDFSIQVLADEIGMSRSNLFKKIKSVSGQSSNSFIRFIRLRKAAEIFINTDNTILETSYLVGINDPKYFREQFNKLFNMNPSQYIKKYRKNFSHNLAVNPDMVKYR